MLKKLLLVIFLLTLVFQLFTQERIDIAVHDYPPYYDEEGKGLLGDLLKAIFNEVDIEANIITLPVERGVHMLLNYQMDAHSPGHIFFAEHINEIRWLPYFNVMVAFFYYKPSHGGKTFNSLIELKGYDIKVVKNSPYLELYDLYALDYSEIETPEQMVQMAKSGRIDFFETSVFTGLTLIYKLFPDDWENFSFFILNELECSLAVSKTNPAGKQLLDKFSEGAKRLKEKGIYKKIYESYWGKDNIPKGALVEGFKDLGTDDFDVSLFLSYEREPFGRIKAYTIEEK